MSNKLNNNHSVLIVDDDPNELKSLVIGLRLEGFTTKGVESGSSALRELEQQSFNAVLIDLMMPEMNGLQLARAVRSSFPSVRTILMSAYHLSPTYLARADTGIVGFVPKPFQFDQLVKFIAAKIDPENTSIMPGNPNTYEMGGLHFPIEVPVLAGRGEATSNADTARETQTFK